MVRALFAGPCNLGEKVLPNLAPKPRLLPLPRGRGRWSEATAGEGENLPGHWANDIAEPPGEGKKLPRP